MSAASLFRFEPGSAGTLTKGLRSILDAFVDVVEPVFTRGASAKRSVIVQQADGTFAGFHGRSQAGERIPPEAAELSARTREVELRLDPSKVVVATLTLPEPALAFADRVIEHRIDRLTPWRSDRAVFGFRPGPVSNGQAEVTIHAASREMTEASVERLARSGYRVVAIGAAPPGEALAIDLLRQSAGAPGRSRRRWIATGAIIVLLASVVFYGSAAWMVSSREQALADVQSEIGQARQRLVAQASGAFDEKAARLIAGKSPERAVFLLLDRLATAIPDSTYLERLDVEADEVRLAGRSLEASALPQIVQSVGLTDARFEASVTREADGRDRFEMVARRPVPAAADATSP